MGPLGIDTSPQRVAEGSLNDRAARSFEFLVKLRHLRTRVVRLVDAYRAVKWLGELPATDGLQFGGDHEDQGVCLAIERVDRVAPPVPPDVLRPWLTERSLHDSSRVLPALSHRAIQVVTDEGDHETQTLELRLKEERGTT